MPTIVVSRQTYRELVDGSPMDQPPWPQPLIAVAPIDTAKQDDVAESLSRVHWDLVIVDEAHILSGPQRMALLERLISAKVVGRLLLITATPLPFFGPCLQKREDRLTSLLPDLAFTNWFAQIQDWEGQPIVRQPVQWAAVDYRRGPDEVAFLQMLQDGLREQVTNQATAFVRQILLQRAASSAFAVEQSLKRLQRSLKLQAEEDNILGIISRSDENSEDVDDDNLPEEPWSRGWGNHDAAIAFVEASLASLEQVQSDEKLATVTRLLQGLVLQPGSKVCVISSYLDSLSYLHSALSELNITADSATGEQAFSEREEAVSRFLREGTILLTTDVVMEGFSLAQVNHVIHFDLPQSPKILMQRQGRFDRFSRTQPLTMYYFRDTSGVLSLDQLVEQLIEKGKELLRSGILPE